jgi:esterase/lipase superfamily enzyme
MIIVTQNIVSDSDRESVVIIFKNDEDRKVFAKQLMDMPDKDNVRVHATFNPEIIDGPKRLIDECLKRAGYDRGIEIFS